MLLLLLLDGLRDSGYGSEWVVSLFAAGEVRRLQNAWVVSGVT